ncbi:hypothetical protein [Metapseudomonas otitidis]|uniref:hypothetical protein n=1 Tax=Metapseudomonas otitidis TaxID=319939 RepID=UPI001CA3E367|nr:hypothetical protein [Pseudomonas otitidis]QZX80492.1 hypothetical protein K6751_14350 [Pseudomonas otitidis]QZX80507.1 hypothetical protein K6751_14425 [Pseudomonas otitidis]
MIIHDRCFCDLCGQLIGQLWNQPAQAPDLLPSDTHRECVDCKARAASQCEPEVVQ